MAIWLVLQSLKLSRPKVCKQASGVDFDKLKWLFQNWLLDSQVTQVGGENNKHHLFVFRLFGNSGACSACGQSIPASELVMRAQGDVYHLKVGKNCLSDTVPALYPKYCSTCAQIYIGIKAVQRLL